MSLLQQLGESCRHSTRIWNRRHRIVESTWSKTKIVPILHIKRLGYQSRFSFSSLQLPDVGGHFVHDIGETIEKKMMSISCYQTQFPEAKSYVLDRVRAAAHYFGSTAGYRAGELLLSPRTIGTDNLMQTIFGDSAI